MNKYEKEHVDRIINEIKQIEKTRQMSDVEKAYYLYKSLGEIYQYKVDYEQRNIVVDIEKKVEIYEAGTTEEGDAICIDMNKTYVEALNLLSIPAHMTSVNGQFFLTHVDACFKDENGKWYYTNLVADIMHIKTGMKIRNFGLSQEQLKHKDAFYLIQMNKQNDGEEFSHISEEQLKQWDDEQGYTFKGLYTNDILNMLASEMKDDKVISEYFGTDKQDELIQKKLEFIFDKLEIVNVHRRKNIGDIEAMRYYNKIIERIFTKEQINNYINVYNGYIEEQGVRVARNIIVVKKDNQNVYYLYSHNKQIFEKIEKEELLKEQIRFDIFKEKVGDITELIENLESQEMLNER